MRTRQGKLISQNYYPTGPGRTEKSRKEFEKFQRALAFKDAIKDELWRAGRPETPWLGAVRITVDAYFERPDRLCKKKSPEGRIPHTAKPDRDNVDKAVLDALKDVGLFRDDAQVCDGCVRKWYVAKGCGPGVIIVAERLADGLFAG